MGADPSDSQLPSLSSILLFTRTVSRLNSGVMLDTYL